MSYDAAQSSSLLIPGPLTASLTFCTAERLGEGEMDQVSTAWNAANILTSCNHKPAGLCLHELTDIFMITSIFIMFRLVSSLLLLLAGSKASCFLSSSKRKDYIFQTGIFMCGMFSFRWKRIRGQISIYFISHALLIIPRDRKQCKFTVGNEQLKQGRDFDCIKVKWSNASDVAMSTCG